MTGFTHSALVYESDNEFVDTVAPFAGDGVTAGDHVVVVTTPANASAVREELGDLAGAVDFFDSAEWYSGSPWQTLRRYLQWLDGLPPEGGRRVLGEQAWIGRSDYEATEWLRYESFANVTFDSPRNSVICSWDARRMPESLIDGLYATHPEVIASELPERSVQCASPNAFAAELDRRPLAPPAGPVAETTFTDLRDVRRALQREAQQRGIDGDRAGEFALALNEVATNALKHGLSEAKLTIWGDGRELVCEVADAGPGVDDPLVGHTPPAGRGKAGWGLWTARLLSDWVELRSNERGTVVRLRLALN
ncbi:MAG: hypothetical protein QOE60_2469 [Thermoleophilaceae bacterium]|nr:hypothetical protein [Thermoleophilaceae bacterium]